jgi:hypothetical protein
MPNLPSNDEITRFDGSSGAFSEYAERMKNTQKYLGTLKGQYFTKNRMGGFDEHFMRTWRIRITTKTKEN